MQVERLRAEAEESLPLKKERTTDLCVKKVLDGSAGEERHRLGGWGRGEDWVEKRKLKFG